jgi:hypothetical protein
VTIVGGAPDVAATRGTSPSPRATTASALTLVALVALALPLLSFALIGWFSRYAADDYCTAAQVAVSGFAQAQSNLYVNWSGRFTATLFNTLLEVAGISLVPLLAASALLAWVTAATWAIRQLGAVYGWRLTVLTSAVLATLLVYATLRVTADLPQDVYWQTGLVTYLLPLILATLFLGWLARYGLRDDREIGWPLALGVCFGLGLLAGGSSETFAVAQVAALGLAVVAGLLVAAGRVRGMLLAGLLGAVLALAIIAVAPGNEVRQASSVRTPLPLAISQTIDFTGGWLRLTFARPHAAELVLLIGIPAVLGAITPQTTSATRNARPFVILAGLVVGVVAVLFACMLPAFYALNTNPPGRAQLIPEYVVLFAVGVLAWCVGASLAGPISRLLRKPLALAATGLLLLGLLVLGPLRSVGDTLGGLPAARNYAASWDQLDQQVRADRLRGVDAVTVQPLPPTGSVQNLDFVGPDRTNWFNQCVAGYYGVGSIAANPGG